MKPKFQNKLKGKSVVLNITKIKLIQKKLTQGLHLHKAGHYDVAKKIYEEILDINPNHFDAIQLLGTIALQTNNYEKSIELLSLALRLNSNNVSVLNNLGNALRGLDRFHEAIILYEKAIIFDKNLKDTYLNRGIALHKLSKYKEALESFMIAINLNPDYVDAYVALGDTLQEMGQFNDALKSYELAINLNSDNDIAYANQGVALHELRKFDAALESFDRAILIKSEEGEIYFNRGNTYEKLGNFIAAIENYDRCISLRPGFAKAYLNRATVLQLLKKFDAALESYQRAYYLDPNLEYLLGTIVLQRLAICDWSGLTQSLMLIESEIFENKKVINPFTCIGLFDNPHSHFLVSKHFTEFNFPINNTLGEISNPPHHGKLRIGYYSADLFYHPASIWLAEQLENHDKSKFELIAFSLKLKSDPMQARLQEAFDLVIDVRYRSDMEVVQLSRELKIDIAIDLNTHTLDSRLGIFAARVAPIQVMSIGYPGSSGAQYIDYFLSDSYGVSQDNRPYFSEKIAFVPSLTTYDRQREVSNEPLYRSQFGLPETGFVFTCQNGCQKFNPDVFDIWMEILKAVPGSVLWLLKPNESAIQNLIKEAQIRGIDSERLIFTDREVVPMEQEKNRISRYLASYKLADLFLDTWPYNAGTTAVDALWAGTPVITKVGNAISARMCYSALKHIELPELITYTANEYRNLAISLATDPNRLKLIKEKLEKNRLSTALFDPVGNTRHIENAYLEMYRKYSEGLPPSDIYTGA